MRKLLFILIAAAGAILVYLAYESRRVPVAVVTPQRGTAVQIVYGTGAVEPVRWAKVASVVRERIVEVCECEGRFVHEGDVLAKLDDRELRAQLQELGAREEFAKREVSRVTELIGRGVATTQSHERTSMELRTIQALILVQTAKLADYTIVAPRDGIVLRQDGEVGEIAEQGQILFRVGMPKPLRIRTEINEEDIPRVQTGQRVLLRTDAFIGSRLEGTVREITPMGDPVAKTYRIFVALPDDTPLKPGMSVEANVVTLEKPNVLLVPPEALNGKSAFTINGTRVARRNVEVGIRGTTGVEIISGLTDGERIATPAANLRDRARIRIIPATVAQP